MKVATFNANSIRVRLPTILDWLDAHRPDVLALQETKVADANFPVAEIRERGWHVAFHGQKSYNGVATISRYPLENVEFGLGREEFSGDYRVLAGTYAGVRIINSYVPNGSRLGSDKFLYKLNWLEQFHAMLTKKYSPSQPIIWTGDINIAPTPEDVYNSPRHYGKVGHHPAEFERLNRILHWGFRDVFRKFHEGPGHYTFWEFVIPRAIQNNLGWRIDHIYATESVYAAAAKCEVDMAPRLAERPSDHTFVWAEFDL